MDLNWFCNAKTGAKHKGIHFEAWEKGSASLCVQLPPLQQPKIDPEPLPLHRSNLLSDWLKAARRRPDERYQLDLFTIAWEEDEFKMKCIECAKIYAVRLHQSLSNFETHLKNRTNRGFVDRRLSGGV